ncbi:MAG: hypothetical protein IJH39_09370 [Clostridia bacterium]|nr:hypothetical protein [Clostridia bacterium]
MANINPNNASKNSSTKFVEPKNPLDPIVEFDPEFGFSNIIMPFNNYSDDLAEKENAEINTLNTDGIDTPLLKLNNKVIFQKQIYSLVIYLRHFLPEIKVTIGDSDRNVQASDVPGMNNVITVIMTAPVDGANKKISLDFYITECTFNDDNSVTYIGEYKANGLKQVKYTQVGKEQLSMYELLKEIAKELKLGFACTEKCKEIEDKEWRQIYSLTYKDFIIQELDHAGLDEDSIFDAWVDNFGYLVMVNVAHIMNEKIDYRQLTTKVITGKSYDMPEGELPEPEVDEVYRIITNSQEGPGASNLMIGEYHSVVNNEAIMNKGTLNRYYYLNSPCDQNLINQEQIQIIEDSVDGIEGTDEYEYENIEYIGANQDDDDAKVCKLIQEQIVTNYFNKLYSKMINVTLNKPNYSLQRGMLVTMILEEYSPRNKQLIMNNANNSVATGKDEKSEAPKTEMEERDAIIDENNGVINPSLSGIYYIKEIEFNYNGGLEQITQKLTLVKKGVQSNLSNKYTSPKFVS